MRVGRKNQIVHTMNIENNIWIGLAQVSSKSVNGLLGSSKGAYVNVLALASNSNDFTEKVIKAIKELELDFVQIEDVELFSERIESYEINDNIINLAIEVNKSKELRFGNFHTFEN
jgi:hypothetical protein